MAQQLTLRFEGSNANNENEKMFTVDIDGTPYHSQDAEELSNGRARQMEIPNLTLGSHTIKVYRDDNNAAANDEDSETAVYSNTFQLRQGYDMVISIRRNGQVSFSEKRNATFGTAAGRISLHQVQFALLHLAAGAVAQLAGKASA